ncbi:unnamed protein product [marine sediment metagenome]|uniref:Uncharacterized protein n=1 Tax=marine sediment metagenome TaxID=412755 RepID=X0WWZ1_9ZZZZ
MKYKVWIQIEDCPETDEDVEACGFAHHEPDELFKFDTLEEAQAFTTGLFGTYNHVLALAQEVSTP